MELYIRNLLDCVLFKSLDYLDIKKVLSSVNYYVKSFSNEEIVAIEGNNCNSVGIILNGNIEIHKSFSDGKVVTINHFNSGNIFGEALVFSGNHKYPATIISSNVSEVLYIEKDDILKMLTLDTRILNNFMSILSNRILMLNDRISALSLDTLRKKVISMLLSEYGRQKSLYLTMPYSRKKMAELLNIPRPSLSRELVKMKDDGLIDFYKNKIKILDLKLLEKSLL